MKIIILITTILLSHTIAHGQQWLNFAPSSSSDYLNINDLDVTGDSLTLEALVSIQDTNRLNGLNIFSKHSGPIDCNYLLRPNRFELTTTNGYVLSENPTAFCPDSVYHLAATYDGSSVKFYVNGSLVDSTTHSGALLNNNHNTAIGNRAWNPNEQFKGYIDEARIWNVARTQSELANNMYNLANPTAQTGLLAYYKFNGDFVNAQGNTSWDGAVVGTQISLASNAFFWGNVSTGPCSFPTSISEVNNPSLIQIIPNPSNGRFTIKTTMSNLDASQLRITNHIGQIIFAQDFESYKNNVTLDVPNGIYFVMVTTGQEVHSERLLIQR